MGEMKQYDNLIYWHYWNDFSYLRIPKTGSTSAVSFMTQKREKDPQEGFKFTIVRDVHSRAYSSYHECLRRRTFQGTYEQFLNKLISEGHVFDEHTLPQTYYIFNNGHDLDAVFMSINDFGKYFNLTLPTLNRTKEKKNEEMVLNQDKVNYIYADDVAFLNSFT